MVRWLNPKFICVVSTILVNTACTQSPTGSVEELIKTRPPTFGGARTATFATPSTAFILNGECDPISYGVEYSIDDGVTWTDIPAGCPLSVFSINLGINRQVIAMVRSRTKTGFTSSAIATIRLLLPPTDPHLQFVSSTRNDDELVFGSQNEITFLSGESLSNAWALIKTSLSDMIYE